MRNRKAFTLVELLVVIGIISLLLSMLMPALARVRESGNRTKCRASLHDLGTALTMYLNESNRKLPFVNTMPSLVPPLNAYPSIVTTLSSYNSQSKGVFQCNSDKIKVVTAGAPTGVETYFQREQSSYMFNPDLGTRYAGWEFKDALRGSATLATLVVFSEYEPFHGPADTVGAMNFLFADMHAGDIGQ